MPAVSVIIPVRNGHNYLQEALEAIHTQEVAVEIIVVDDGSTDDTVEIATAAGCRVIRHGTSKGPVEAKNTGIAAAAGDFILFHDHDDRMRPGALNLLLDAISKDDEAMAVEAKVQDFYSPELSEEARKGVAIKLEPYYGLFSGAILMRRSIFDVIGFFPGNIRAGEILHWQQQMDRNALVVRKLDIVSTDRRVHTSNFGRTDRRKEMQDYAALLRMRLKR